VKPWTLPLALCAISRPLNDAAACAREDQSGSCGAGTPCLKASDMPKGATARHLMHGTIEWIGAYAGERSKRKALIEAWPR
jgi:hypothetical protein